MSRARWLRGVGGLLGGALVLGLWTQCRQPEAPAPPSDPRVAAAMPPPVEGALPELLACVFTDEGQPLVGEEVHVFESWADFHGERDVVLHETGADGCVHLPGTAPRWALWFSPLRELPSTFFIDWIFGAPRHHGDAVHLGPERSRWAWSMGPTCPARFEVTDAAGAPVAGAWIFAGRDGHFMPQGLGETDAAGVLEAELLSCSAERVGVTPPEPFERRWHLPLDEAVAGIRLRRAP